MSAFWIIVILANICTTVGSVLSAKKRHEIAGLILACGVGLVVAAVVVMVTP